MSKGARGSLIIGAASKLGVALMRELLDSNSKQPVVAADTPSNQDLLKQLISDLNAEGLITPVQYHGDESLLGFHRPTLELLEESVTKIFHFAHSRDRTQKASFIKQHNKGVFLEVLDVARKIERLASLIVVTDVGLVGDYPGRFSEGWVDTGQTPFDEVDRSSLEVELLCLEASDLPITRVRVGLLSDLEAMLPGSAQWPSAAKTLVPFVRILKKVPKFLKIPVFVQDDSVAPLTPTTWAVSVMSSLSDNPDACGSAFHLVVSPLPKMLDVLSTVATKAGGAGIKRGFAVGYTKLANMVPGLSETTKRQADQVASWWTPHRYCLSKNDLDTGNLEKYLSKDSCLHSPEDELLDRFFLNIDLNVK